MARTVDVAIAGGYPVYIGTGLDPSSVPPGTSGPGACAILTDSTVAGLHLDAVRKGLESAGWRVAVTVEVPAGESSKDLEVYAGVMSRLAGAGLSRDATLFALGGGVVGDLGGFVAATYMRGIRLVMLPTTLLAMVDSSVGGKTGVDLPEGKNLVGAFHQPEAVFADLDWLTTLDDEQVSGGLAEVIKMGLLAGGGFHDDLSLVAAAKSRDTAALETLVFRSVEYKARVVAGDERESGPRAVLNYGHTVGHAIEAASSYSVPHGRAVALGMRCAARLSEKKLGFTGSAEQAGYIREAGLPDTVPGLDAAVVVSGMARDKKRLSADGASGHRFVLLKDVGQPEWGVPVTDDEVMSALSGVLVTEGS